MSWDDDRSLVFEGLREVKTAIAAQGEKQEAHREEDRDRIDVLRAMMSDEMNGMRVDIAVMKSKIALVAAGISIGTSAVTAFVVGLAR